MNGHGKFAKVYYEVLTDERFDGIRDDMAAMGSWVTLLIAAEKAWPEPAHVPVIVPRKALARLVSTGLVDPVSGGMFRIHGLDAERQRRSDHGRHANDVRWHSRESPPRSPPGSPPKVPEESNLEVEVEVEVERDGRLYA